jgi:pyrimidine-nucleoside phosphorylase
MRVVDLIIKKRDGFALSANELRFLIKGFTNGEVADYQISAWAMAVLLNGMNEQEITDLTLAMAASGQILDLSSLNELVVDKHSTGGVGDKTTLSVAPIVAACGLPVGKMSGRGLGFSGGTIDKLESIPGYRVDLSTQEFISQLKEHGIVLTGQSADLAPADGKLYALRDVTGTVDSIPLIASSVMSKKIAAGAQAIVLDVKVGEGAFMRTLEDARELARLMVAIGKRSGRKVIALLSPMDQPLGYAVGNAIELREAVELLHDQGPEDYRYHCTHLAAYMLILGGKVNSLEQGIQMAECVIKDGSAYKKLCELVTAQGGDLSFIQDLDKLPKAKICRNIVAEEGGYIAEVNAREVGQSAVILGAGRAQKQDKIDLAVGIYVRAKVGATVRRGEILFEVLANDQNRIDEVLVKLKKAVRISEAPVEPPPYFWDVIGLED